MPAFPLNFPVNSSRMAYHSLLDLPRRYYKFVVIAAAAVMCVRDGQTELWSVYGGQLSGAGPLLPLAWSRVSPAVSLPSTPGSLLCTLGDNPPVWPSCLPVRWWWVYRVSPLQPDFWSFNSDPEVELRHLACILVPNTINFWLLKSNWRVVCNTQSFLATRRLDSCSQGT